MKAQTLDYLLQKCVRNGSTTAFKTTELKFLCLLKKHKGYQYLRAQVLQPPKTSSTSSGGGLRSYKKIASSLATKQATNGRSCARDFRLNFVRMVLYWQQCACLMPLRHKSFGHEKAHIAKFRLLSVKVICDRVLIDNFPNTKFTYL